MTAVAEAGGPKPNGPTNILTANRQLPHSRVNPPCPPRHQRVHAPKESRSRTLRQIAVVLCSSSLHARLHGLCGHGTHAAPLLFPRFASPLRVQLPTPSAARTDLRSHTSSSRGATGCVMPGDAGLFFQDHSKGRARDVITASSFPGVDSIENFRARHSAASRVAHDAGRALADDPRCGLTGYVVREDGIRGQRGQFTRGVFVCSVELSPCTACCLPGVTAATATQR